MCSPSVSFGESSVTYVSQLILCTLNGTENKVTTMLTTVEPLFVLAAVLLIAYVGLKIMLGLGNFSEALVNIFKILFIATLLSNAEYGYNQIITPSIDGLKNFIGNPIGLQNINGSNLSVYEKLDEFLETTSQLSDLALVKVELTSPSTWIYLIFSVLTYIFGIVATALMAFMVLGTEVIIRFLLIIGPFFLILFLFNSTRNYLFLWISSISANILLFIIVFFLSNLSIDLVNKIINLNTEVKYETDHFCGVWAMLTRKETMTHCDSSIVTLHADLPVMMGILFYFAIVIKLISEAPTIASALSGGTSAGASTKALASSLISGAAAGISAGIKKFTTPPPPSNGGGGSSNPPPKSPMMRMLSGMANVTKSGAQKLGMAGSVVGTAAKAAANKTGLADSIANLYNTAGKFGVRGNLERAGAVIQEKRSQLNQKVDNLKAAPGKALRNMESYNRNLAEQRESTYQKSKQQYEQQRSNRQNRPPSPVPNH